MDKRFAWFLGYLATDGHLGEYQSISFCIHQKDTEGLDKIKDILHTQNEVKLAHYKNQCPTARLQISDRKDIPKEYWDIKLLPPKEKIKGFERHYIRGLVDGDGCINYRPERNSFRVSLINESFEILDWVAWWYHKELGTPPKTPIMHKDNIFDLRYEGKIGKLIAWYLYNGNIQDCCLQRKLDYYKQYFLSKKQISNGLEEFIIALNLEFKEDRLLMNTFSEDTLRWCHIIQKQFDKLGIKSTPIPAQGYFKSGRGSRGKTKEYYQLYVPQLICKPIGNNQSKV